MIVLALETSADVCSLAVRDAQGTLVERAFRHRMHLSERLMGDVAAVLADAEIALSDVDLFAVGIGPGSFTGVRVGVTTVKTWADLLGKPVCGVSSLDAVAAEYAGIESGTLVVSIRARPGQIYAGCYRVPGETVDPLAPPELISIEELAGRLKAHEAPYYLVGDALARSREAIQQALEVAGIAAQYGRSESPRAAMVAAVAAARFALGRQDDPIALTPLYLAPPPIGGKREAPSSPIS